MLNISDLIFYRKESYAMTAAHFVTPPFSSELCITILFELQNK